MARIKEFIYKKKPQYFIFLVISLAAATFTWMLYYSSSAAFQRYFGNTNPLLVVFLVALAGIIAWPVLLARGWFLIYKKEHFLRGWLTAAALAMPLGIVIILVDLMDVFPADINVLFPGSLLFYPAIAFVVEIVFHLLPLTLLLTILTSLSGNLTYDKIIWPCILLVSIAEPIFQTVLGASNTYPQWAELYIAFHIFLINLIQLWLFKRYDFISMYAFRLVYYLIWHIGWGWVRLEVLF